MNGSKSYGARLFIIIFIFMIFLSVFINAAFYWGINELSVLTGQDSGFSLSVPFLNAQLVVQNMSDITKNLQALSANFFVWVVPAVSAFFILSALILWLILRGSLASAYVVEKNSDKEISRIRKNLDEGEVKDGRKDHADQRMEQERQRRMFLHFLSVLQREGRLLDFFSEDLSLYDDEQIGAAVRSIHEDCRKSVEKYLSLKPVLDFEEGDSVDVPAGFDPDAIRLTGNVSGAPPFKGILRHRGWKAGKKDLPRLSDVLDSSIIAPAEVEVE